MSMDSLRWLTWVGPELAAQIMTEMVPGSVHARTAGG
jgi:hypothetical protein